MAHFEGKLTARDGGVLYYQGWESENLARAVVCLVHGLGEHSGRYEYVARALNAAGYHVMALDLRGHGKTPGKRGDVPDYQVVDKDISLLMTEAVSRYPALPQVIYGHSMGGIVVLHYCLNLKPRVAGVVITSPGLRTALEDQKGKILLVKLLGAALSGMTMPTGLDATGISRDPAVIERYLNDALVHDQATLGLAKHSLDAIRYIYEHGSAWELPLVLMHGTADKIAYPEGSEKFASLVKPGLCTLRMWPGLAHELHNEPEKEEVLAYLVERLDGFLTNVA